MSIIPIKFLVTAAPMFKPIRVFTLLSGILTAGVALAETARIDLPVTVQPGESYPALVARASKLAGDSIDRRFQANTAADRVNLVIIAENSGEIAPLLSVDVSRQQWRGNPNIQRWAKVFPFGKDLLGFRDSQPAPSPNRPAPTASPPPAATPPAAKKPPALMPDPLDVPDSGPQRPAPDQRLRPSPTGQGQI